MAFQSRKTAALAIALLLCLPAVVFGQTTFVDRNTTTTNSSIYGNYVSGPVVSTNRDLNYFTIRDQSGANIKIDVRGMDTGSSINVWQLRPGDVIAVNGGWTNGNTFRASTVSYSSYRPTTNVNASTYDTLFGTVTKVNRNLKFVTVRDQSGNEVKVDVRKMDTRQSVNVWDLKAGDPLVVNGAWTKKNTFRANRVNVANYQSMTSGYGSTANFINGTVQSVNRDLGYVTVRDDATGNIIKIDVRKMDTRRSVNVWQLRTGDRIATSGTWENRDTFQADRVNF